MQDGGVEDYGRQHWAPWTGENVFLLKSTVTLLIAADI